MDGELRAHLELLPHEYPEDAGAPVEAWGRLGVSLATHRSRPPIRLLTWSWDLAAFAEWFANNEVPLRTEQLSVAGKGPLPGESLAQALRRLQSREFPDGGDREADEWFDRLYEYRERHELRRALRGARIPAIVIGRNGGIGEISQSIDPYTWEATNYAVDPVPEDSYALPGMWSYNFSMDRFCKHLRGVLLELLGAWSRQASHPEALNRASRIASRLSENEHRSVLEPAHAPWARRAPPSR